MANVAFATSQDAANVANITPQAIGVPANNFVRKSELLATNKFDAAALQPYGNNNFIPITDVQRGTFMVAVAMNSDVATRGTVKIGSGQAGVSAQKECSVGESGTVVCTLNNAGDVFDGWYNGNTKVSSNASYTFTANEAVTLVARIFYIDVSKATINLGADSDLTDTFIVNSNTSWSITST